MKASLATALLLLLMHPDLRADIALPQAQDRRIDTSGPGIYQFVQLMNADDFPEFHFSLLCGGNQTAAPHLVHGGDQLRSHCFDRQSRPQLPHHGDARK